MKEQIKYGVRQVIGDIFSPVKHIYSLFGNKWVKMSKINVWDMVFSKEHVDSRHDNEL